MCLQSVAGFFSVGSAMSTLYVLKEGHKWGPFTTEELGERVEKGVFALDDLLWVEGMEDWQPISTMIERVPEPVIEEVPPETLYEAGDILITTRGVELEDYTIPVEDILQASAQKEAVHRVWPVIWSVVLGVAIVCLAVVLPRQTFTHWTVWGGVTVGLFIVWLRMMYAALRTARCHVTIDLKGGDERILRATPASARPIAEAVNLAVEHHTGIHPSHRPAHHLDSVPSEAAPTAENSTPESG